MKKTSILFTFYFLLFTLSSTFAYTQDDIQRANFLARSGIIVDHTYDPASYRLDDPVLRQEIVGMMVKADASITVPENYQCKWYYTDATFAATSVEAWVCRAAEIGADNDIITRYNTRFRPRDKVTRAEALAMVVEASGMQLTPSNYTGNWLSAQGYADWQTKLLDSITDCRIYNHGISCEDGSDGNIAKGQFRPNAPATRADVFEFMAYSPFVESVTSTICDDLLSGFEESDNVEDVVFELENILQQCLVS